MKLLDVTRGRVTFEFEEQLFTVNGEGLLPGIGDVDYVLYENSLVRDGAPVIDAERGRTLEALRAEMTQGGLKVEIE